MALNQYQYRSQSDRLHELTQLLLGLTCLVAGTALAFVVVLLAVGIIDPSSAW